MKINKNQLTCNINRLASGCLVSIGMADVAISDYSLSKSFGELLDYTLTKSSSLRYNHGYS